MDTSSHTNPDKRTYQETMPYIKRTISHNESDNPTQGISKEYISIKHPRYSRTYMVSQIRLSGVQMYYRS